MPKEETPIIQFATVSDDIVVLRVIGRGTFQNSTALEKLIQDLESKKDGVRYILDLEYCNYLDSTFIGVLAHLGCKQLEHGFGKMQVVNLNDHTQRLLSTLGMGNVMDLHEATVDLKVNNGEFQQSQDVKLDKYNQIVHMIESHQKLIDLDSSNEVRFQNVVKVLKESLERETARQGASNASSNHSSPGRN